MNYFFIDINFLISNKPSYIRKKFKDHKLEEDCVQKLNELR
jgi:hypothetical protein